MRKLYEKLASLDLGIWLIVGVIILMAAGSFSSGASESGGINDMALFTWLQGAPAGASWWLWATIGLLAVLALNTVLCSIESLRSKSGSGRFLLVIAPQVMHLGFLLIMVAHLQTSIGGKKEAMQLVEGSTIGFPGGGMVRVEEIMATPGPMGMLVDFGARFRYGNSGEKVAVARPNHPLFIEGFGIYVKDVGMMPMPVAIVEIHREPGAMAALVGGLLFTIGNVVLLAVRRGKNL